MKRRKWTNTFAYYIGEGNPERQGDLVRILKREIQGVYEMQFLSDNKIFDCNNHYVIPTNLKNKV